MCKNKEDTYVTIQQWNQMLREMQALKVMLNYQTLPVVTKKDSTSEEMILQGLYEQALKLEQEIFLLKQFIVNAFK
ncbi:hypothetical protein [Bacillus cereus]|uniref:hypothetical protein n=1 Tax=Bacillus cereus TaxID=1396 RepID=UPI000BF41262|nr:hypothetical protein [Bacillus cereus]PEQ68070.1 hypothetical protein CN469_04300 [Bacillus cereus]